MKELWLLDQVVANVPSINAEISGVMVGGVTSGMKTANPELPLLLLVTQIIMMIFLGLEIRIDMITEMLGTFLALKVQAVIPLVVKLTRENHSGFDSFPWGFLVKDFRTGLGRTG